MDTGQLHTPASPPAAALAGYAARIHSEEIRHLYRLSRAAYPGTLVNAAIVCFALWDVVPNAALAIWAAAIVLVTGARYALYRDFLAREVTPAEAPAWGRYFTFGAFAGGAMWGVLGALLYPDTSIPHQFVVIFVVGGMLMSAMVILAPLPRAYMVFVLTAWSPLVVTVLLQGSTLHYQMGVLMTVFLMVMLGTGPVMARSVRESLRARFENNELVRQLYEAHGESREANRRLNEQNAAHRRTEESLREATNNMEALIDASPLAIVVRDREGRVQKWNDAAARIFGWKEPELVGSQVPYVPPELAEEGNDFRERTLKGETIAITETTRLHKDGTRILVSFSAAPLFDGDGNVTGYVAMIGDIRARKRAEQQQNLQSAITVLLAESQSVEEAVPRVLRFLCETLAWDYGARWVVDRDRMVLRCAEYWCIRSPGVEAFHKYSESRRDKPGQYAGLLRRVWTTGAPVWLDDLRQEPTLERREQALAAGLGTAFAFPIVVGGEFFGVMEFFGPGPRARDETVIRLSASVGGQIGQFIARRQAEHDLQFVASHDALTGLLNRAMFIQRVQQALAQAQRHERTLAVLFVDLDGFKAVNDTLGHDAGDTLLMELADRLRESLREGDTVGRMGGDEFVVLIEEYAEEAQLMEVARKLLETVAQPFLLREQSRQVTASIGIATFGADGRDVQTLLRHADVAMYRAKQRGKNQFQFFSNEINTHLTERLSLESSLRLAVERGELLLYYQPRVALDDERVLGVEALVRWRHPLQGIINPAEFVPVAEDAGLIAAMGEWVLQAVCAQTRIWREIGLAPMRVAVNLSARQITQDNFLQRLRETLHHAALDPGQVELEITESVLLRHEERATRLLPQLKEAGLRLVLDDFGTGYSSLGSLRRFPFDGVNIDRSLVLALPGNTESAAVVRAAVGMAHGLGLTVIGEGIETVEQRDFLKGLACDAAQGNFFCPAGPAETVTRILSQPGGLLKRASIQPLRAPAARE